MTYRGLWLAHRHRAGRATDAKFFASQGCGGTDPPGCVTMYLIRDARRCTISSQPEPEDQDSLAIPLTWGDTSRVPVLAANQLAVQVDALGTKPDLVIITIGHASAPVLVGTDEQKREAAERIREVEVQPLARVSLSVGRLKQWAALLQTTADKLDEVPRGEG